MLNLTAVVAVLLLSSPSEVAGLGRTAGEIVHPNWREVPSAASRNSAFPLRAMQDAQVGTATVQCVAKVDGSFAGCRVICESPADYGFGLAAVRIAAAYKLVPTLDDGRSVENMTVTMPMFFSPESSMNPPRCDVSTKP